MAAETQKVETVRGLTVWMYFDEYASMVSDDKAKEWNEANPDKPPKQAVDVDYEEAEATLTAAFPGVTILFSRNKPYWELKNGCPSLYVFDIGMLGGGFGGGRYEWCNGLYDQIADHPDTVFLPWSSFTQRYMEGVLADTLGEDCKIDNKIPPNVVILDEEEIRKCGLIEDELLAKLKKLYQDRRVKNPLDSVPAKPLDGG